MSAPNGGEGSNGNSNNGLLPSSAPVSSLLPPIPIFHQQQNQVQHQQHTTQNPAAAALAALTASAGASGHSGLLQQQLAALLQGNAAACLPQQQQLQHHQQMSPQLLAAATARADPAQLQMQQANWSLKPLEQHVSLLQGSNTALLLAEARKRDEKRHAKRLANRKSACSSRARKKALVQEMTELNTRLRRQALILNLLPDLVIVIDPMGKITFCSAQVERVLCRSIEHDLIGANIADILVPGSQTELQKLVQRLLGKNKPYGPQNHQPDGKPSEEMATSDAGDNYPPPEQGKRKAKKQKKSGDDAKVAKQAFPLKVVKVDAAADASAGSDENGETSDASKQPSSITNSCTNSGASDNDNAVLASAVKKKAAKPNATSSDASSNSEGASFSAEPSNNLLSANANLERNVRWHNKNRTKRSGYKDDVNGAAVTANNASARLSSLQHLGSSSEEDDSGYRESNESREDTSSSSEGESSAEEGCRRAIAPTCNVCLIRNDLSTIWCEVTSSIRSKETEMSDASSTSSKKKAPFAALLSASLDDSKPGPKKRTAEEANVDEETQEILLCLRPIRDVESSSKMSSIDSKQQRVVSEDNTTNISSGEDTSDSKPAATGYSNDLMSSSNAKGGKISEDQEESDNNKDCMDDDFAVESLMAMSKSP